VILGALLLMTSGVGCCPEPSSCGHIDNSDVLNFYEDSIEVLEARISLAFDNAEKKVLSDSVIVVPVPKGPHEDPKKCVCGGSGTITHGDGHKTPCPFHSKQAVKKPSLIVDGDILYKRSK
jgi:hypothetical protein